MNINFLKQYIYIIKCVFCCMIILGTISGVLPGFILGIFNSFLYCNVYFVDLIKQSSVIMMIPTIIFGLVVIIVIMISSTFVGMCILVYIFVLAPLMKNISNASFVTNEFVTRVVKREHVCRHQHLFSQ